MKSVLKMNYTLLIVGLCTLGTMTHLAVHAADEYDITCEKNILTVTANNGLKINTGYEWQFISKSGKSFDAKQFSFDKGNKKTAQVSIPECAGTLKGALLSSANSILFTATVPKSNS